VAKRKVKKVSAGGAPNLLLVTKENRHGFHSALHYAQYDMTDKQLKSQAIKYARDKKLNHKLLNALTDKELALFGKYAYIVNGGGMLPEDYVAGFQSLLDRLFAKAKLVQAERKAAAKEKAKEAAGPVLTVQDRMRMQAEELCAEFDGWIDELSTGAVKTIPKHMDPGSKMKAAGFKAGQARYVRGFYEPELAMVKEVLKGKDADLKEGYSNVAKSSLIRMEKLLDKIVTEAKVIELQTKAQRKTRKRKAPSIEKQIGKLKYCEAFPDYGIASVNPAEIIGAKEVWIFNTKYRKLGKYVAQDESGLTVKGTSIKDFSADQSRCKTLRKPKEQLADFMKAGKVKLRKFLDEIKAVDAKMNGRMNDNIVILKVFK
jgi:hypothetical protein